MLPAPEPSVLLVAGNHNLPQNARKAIYATSFDDGPAQRSRVERRGGRQWRKVVVSDVE